MFPVLFTALALAAPLHNLKVLPGSVELEKRDEDARFTFYDAGQNACGSTDSDSAFVSADFSSESWQQS